MTGDARSLFGDRLFGNLVEDLLTFFQQIGDQGLRPMRVRAQIVATSATAPLAAAIVARTLNLPLLVGRSRSRRPQLRSSVGFLVVLFLFFLVAANHSSLAAFFCRDYFVFVDIGNLGNPAV